MRPRIFYEAHLARVLEIWKLWDQTAKQKKWDSVYVGNLGGGIRAVTDLRKIAEVAGWFNADQPGPHRQHADLGLRAAGTRGAIADEGPYEITNVTGSYANSRPLWRHTAKSPEEATMWMAQPTASGMTDPVVPLAGRRARGSALARYRRQIFGIIPKFFQWIAREEQHFVNRASIANLGVVFSGRVNGFYSPPGGGETTEFLQALYLLCRARRALPVRFRARG